MYRLFNTINYCHNKGIIHSNIKLKNIIFLENKLESDFKLTGFRFNIDQYKINNIFENEK